MTDPPVFGDNGGGPVASAGGRAGKAHGNVYSMTYSGSYVVAAELGHRQLFRIHQIDIRS